MLTIHDIRRLAAADPANLPQIYVHTNATWSGGVRPDRNANLHMCEVDFLRFKQQVPVEPVMRGHDVTVFRLALDRHHLEGGGGDVRELPQGRGERLRAAREATGRDPDSGVHPGERVND